MNTRGEHELDHAQNKAEPENQVGFYLALTLTKN